MMADFQNCLLFRIFSVFVERFFAQNNSKGFVELILTCFLEFKFLTQSEVFPKPIGFAWWPIFKMVSFLEHLAFFGGFFCSLYALIRPLYFKHCWKSFHFFNIGYFWRIPTGRRQISWLWTCAAEELNQGLAKTNPACGQSWTWTQDLQISSTTP